MLQRLPITLILLMLICLTPMLNAAGDLSFDLKESKSFDVNVIDDNQIETALSVKLTEYELEQFDFKGESFTFANAGSAPVTYDAGWPVLPMSTQIVLVPPDKGVQLEIDNIDYYIESCDNLFIAPIQDGSEDPTTPGAPSRDYLQYDGFWPPNPVVISEPAILRGYRLVQVTVYPMQYNPQTSEMRVNENIDYRLVYSGSGVNMVNNPDRLRPSSSVQILLESLVENPPPRRDNPAHAKRGSYLLIWPDVNGVADAIQPLLEWRARQGWEVYTEEVDNRASYNTVKSIIQDAYDEWDNPPEMVVLVGDADGSVAISANSANSSGTTDFDYVRLDGNDFLGDADIGRLSVDNVNQLRQVVAKLVNYEADPWVKDDDDNPDIEWYTNGMVCAGNSISGLSTILVNRWLKRELMLRGFAEEDVHEWYYGDGGTVPNFFETEFRRGIAVSNYRGWIGIESTTPNMVMQYRAHRRYPITAVMTCGSGNYSGVLGMSEAMFRSPGGGIGGIGFCTSSTHVQYNNAVSTGIWVGFLKDKLYHYGTAVTRGKIELWRQYQGHDNAAVENFSDWANLMGDPATHVFLGTPRTIVVEHTPQLSLGESRVTVYVEDEEDETAVEDAFVCLYKADDEYQATAFTDDDGMINFRLPIDELSDGELMITVTKHNTVTYLTEISIEAHDYYLGVSDWQIEDDEDGNPNPGETIEMTLMLTNFGSETPEGSITVAAESLTDFAEVISESVETDQIPGVDESVEIPMTIQLAETIPDETEIIIAVNTVNDDVSWQSAASFEVTSPKVMIEELTFEDDGLDPSEILSLDIEIANIGRKEIAPFTARLRCEDSVIRVIDAEVDYEGIGSGETGTSEIAHFRVSAHPLTVPGMYVTFNLTVEDENGFRDTTYIDYQVGHAEVTDPLGPDDYGYVCFDSGDEGWELHPTYNWIEIDPALDEDFEGENLGLRDTGEDQDESEVVELPFEFQYYGVIFDQITVCTNGWAAFGNWGLFSDFRSRRIASGGGPNAMLCPFWDNLLTGTVLTYYDEDGGQFIIEWSNMRCQNGNSQQSFELILYEQWVEPTYTGDGVFTFQYKEVNNNSTSANNDTPFATVGIGNLDDTDGLEYTYWDDYPVAAKELEDEMALKFSTATDFITGVLQGTVIDYATGDSIPDAEIIASRGPRLAGFWSETDSAGFYSNEEILIGQDYTITVRAQGYNDSSLTGYEILEDEITTVDFALLHPEFNYQPDGFSFTMLPDSTTDVQYHLANNGNGTLAFTSRYVYVAQAPEDVQSPESRQGGLTRDDPDETWEQLLYWNVSNCDSVQDYRIDGIAYVNDKWYITGSNNGDDVNYFYIFDRWGNYIERLIQPIEGRYGIRDMDYYNGYIYGAFNNDFILKIDPETGEEVSRFAIPQRASSIRNVAVLNDTLMYISAQSNGVYFVELESDSLLLELRRYPIYDPRLEATQLHIYGLSWFRDDPDGYSLYIISKDEEERNDEAPDISIFKMNPDDGDVRYLTSLSYLNPNHQAMCGSFITPKWNNLVWAFATVFNNAGGDEVGIFELAPNSSWIDYNPRSDTLFAGEAIDITLQINSEDLELDTFGVVIEFNHNAGEGVTYLPVWLYVVDSLPPPPSVNEDDLLPFEYSLSQNHPNPFNPTTRIDYSLREPGITRLTLYDLLGREVAVLINEHQPAGKYQLTFDAGNLSTGLYFYQIESGNFKAIKKMVLVK